MPSEAILEKKKNQVERLKEKLMASTAGVAVDYRGITVLNDTKLRRELREAGVEYTVIKNNILRRACEEAGLSGLCASITGTTAFAISKDDPIAAAKILHKYAESSKGKYSLKAGFVDGKALDAAGVASLAMLPGKTELLTMLCMALNGNIRGLAVALNAIVEKQQDPAAEAEAPQEAAAEVEAPQEAAQAEAAAPQEDAEAPKAEESAEAAPQE